MAYRDQTLETPITDIIYNMAQSRQVRIIHMKLRIMNIERVGKVIDPIKVNFIARLRKISIPAILMSCFRTPRDNSLIRDNQMLDSLALETSSISTIWQDKLKIKTLAKLELVAHSILTEVVLVILPIWFRDSRILQMSMMLTQATFFRSRWTPPDLVASGLLMELRRDLRINIRIKIKWESPTLLAPITITDL